MQSSKFAIGKECYVARALHVVGGGLNLFDGDKGIIVF